MKHTVPLSLAAAATFACLCGAAGQAATLTSAHLDAPSAHALGLVTKAGWRHHHHRCWWRHHRRHCRYWR